ncbi:MAG: beta-galactosidase [Chloroflexota bacterium]|nr:beta-galactosidase [Chloroflexota bacterium]
MSIGHLSILDPAQETFTLGVCYYPEHWPPDRWAGYARRMREAGLAYVRIAEFAWSRMEPEPGYYEWGWLDEAIDTLHAEGLRVVLCTPTATPPAWLVRAHPEILPVDAEGRVRQFGSRKHYDHASPIYREHSRRITREIAGRYGQHPAVVGWQTDNEFGCHDTTRSYGPASQVAFREWLAARYGTLDDLNEAWGAVFWSQEYGDWDQILPPNLTVTEPNPSHVLDFARYASDMVAEFQAEQVAILRELSPGRWVTHNFMIFFSDFDHYRVAEGLDFVSWDNYPTGMLDRSDEPDDVKLHFARTGEPDLIGFNHDLYRGLLHDEDGSGRAFWVMEQQCGQVNWAASNPLPAPGAIAVWTAQAYAHGASTVSYFRWRAATMAQELMHSGLLRHDETDDWGLAEIGSLELPGRANDPVRTPVALLHDYESLWAYDSQPNSAGASYWGQVLQYYVALRSLGLDVDIVHPDRDLTAYRLVVAPALHLMSSARAAHLTEVARRSHVIFGPRTAFRTPTGRVHEGGAPGPLGALVGWTLMNVDGLRHGLVQHAGGHEVTVWAECYSPYHGDSSAEVVVTYDDGPMATEPAVVRRGNVATIGAWSPTLVTSVLRDTCALVGIETINLPRGVRISRRGGLTTAVNFTSERFDLSDGESLGPVSFRQW